MSLLFGGGGKTKPQFTSLAVQTSTSAIAIAIGFGKNRASHNIIWQGDFKSHKKKQKAGKGGPSQTTYTYSGSYMMALGWGPDVNVVRVWKDASKTTDYAELGMSLFPGTTPQAPWGYLTSAHPDEALGYPGVAYLAVANYDLGQGNSLPQHSFEIEWPLVDTQVDGTGDADPAQVFEAFLTNESYGVGFDFTVFNDAYMFSGPDATTTGDDAYQTYCRAMGFGISPILSSQTAARDTLERWAKITNTAIVWNGYEIKMRAYGTDPVTAHGVTYLPDFSVRYSLSDDDFVAGKGEDPIQFDRTDPADAKNEFSVVISNRSNEYNDLPCGWKDQGLIDQYGSKKADSLDAKEICEPAMGDLVACLIGQRMAYVRNKFRFTLGPQYQLIEPMDVLECYDPRFGTFSVIVDDIEETDDGQYEVSADEFHGSITVAATTSSQTVTNNVLNTGALAGPVNPPIVFEAPRSLTKAQGAVPEVWIAASGGDGTTEDPNWGGCYVWASTDNVTYNQIGVIDTPARMGKLTAALALYGGANPQTGATLKVSLDMSGGELEDATPDDAAAYVTLCYVQGELLSYETADATGLYDYDLGTKLYRGLYGTTAGAKVIGDKFARLDDAIFKYALPTQFIGKTIYFKLQSYNLFGAGMQDLADCVAYSFTPSGAAYGTGTSGKPVTPTGLAGSAGGGFARLTWTPGVANDDITQYKIYRATGASQPFGSAALLDTVSSQSRSYVDNTGTVGQPYTYFLVATNGAGDSTNTAGVNITSVNSGQTLWSVAATGTGASQGVTLPYSGVNEIGVLVFVNGIKYETDEYSIAGTTLTLQTNAVGDSIEVIGITQ